MKPSTTMIRMTDDVLLFVFSQQLVIFSRQRSTKTIILHIFCPSTRFNLFVNLIELGTELGSSV